MPPKKFKIPIIKLLVIAILISFLLSSLLPLWAADPQALLGDITKRKQSIAEKLKETRLKEAAANSKLREIQRKLSQAQSSLAANRRHLKVTEEACTKTRNRLTELISSKNQLELEAEDRLVSIYKQQRLKMIDGLLNSPNITDFLDHVYYQKRVIDYDRQVISALINQSENIRKYNETLKREAQKISVINQQLSSTEQVISQERNLQKQVVNQLAQERALYEASERQLEQESVKLMYKITELASGKDNPDSTGRFIYPVHARISSPFGPRRHPIFGVRSMHSGIDLAAPRSTPIKASEGGKVIYAGWYGGYGKVVIVDHSKGFSTLYAHLSSTAVSVGDQVRQGDTVGYEGDTGYATGPHLHFEVRSQGKPQNPVTFLGNG